MKARVANAISILMIVALTLSTSCKNNSGSEETPGENWKENHETESDTSVSKTDSITSNSTQTDPAVTQ